MAEAKTVKEFLFYGFDLDVFKQQCKSVQSIASVNHWKYFLLLNISGAKYVQLNCKQMIRQFFKSVIESAQKECTVETARKIQDLSNNSLRIIKTDLMNLNRAFDEKVDTYFSIPDHLTGHRCDTNQIATTSGGSTAAVVIEDSQEAADAKERALNEQIASLETVYIQQSVLIQKLRAELTFYATVLDVEADIDHGLCLLVEKSLQENATEADNDQTILEHLQKVLQIRNESSVETGAVQGNNALMMQ